jgi:phage terminase large subunit-like protein
MYQADLVVAERNFGGAMVESVLRAAQPDLSIKLVTASRGKSICAEPIAALYERGRVGHIGDLAGLEAEMVQMTLSGFTGGGSPNALDAMVWALSELVMTNKVCANFLELIQQELREYGIPQAPVVRQIEYARGSQEWLDALQNGTEND